MIEHICVSADEDDPLCMHLGIVTDKVFPDLRDLHTLRRLICFSGGREFKPPRCLVKGFGNLYTADPDVIRELAG